MRKLALSLVVVLAASVSACRCSPAARQAVGEVKETHALVLPAYRSYVERDAALDADQKARRLALVESLERLTERLRKALED